MSLSSSKSEYHAKYVENMIIIDKDENKKSKRKNLIFLFKFELRAFLSSVSLSQNCRSYSNNDKDKITWVGW